jgi:uncharacterized protein YihD (DUF1040 family)
MLELSVIGYLMITPNWHGKQSTLHQVLLGETQWNQLDESVKTAINKHKKLAKYIIAIPIDPPDARIDRQTSMLDNWNTHVSKWMGWATKENLSIEFVPWWHSDLIQRIQKPENAGFILFWFDVELFTDEWFKTKIEIATANLGNRYTPELNFELEIAKIFDGIAQDKGFDRQLHDKFDDMLINIKKINPNYKDEDLSKLASNLQSRCQFPAV